MSEHAILVSEHTYAFSLVGKTPNVFDFLGISTFFGKR